MSSTEHTMPDANRLYIGEGVSIKGEISVLDTLVVCGALEGDVTVGNLVVGETGAIKGRITAAENAEISGKVFETGLDRPRRRKHQLRFAADRAGRQHRRRSFLHRLSAGAEAAESRSLSERSEVSEAGGFARRQVCKPVVAGVAVNSYDASRRAISSV